MATTAMDSGGDIPATNGVEKLADSGTSGDTTMEVEADEAKLGKTSMKPFTLNTAPGPPILHPTITTWQWLFAASDMSHTPSIIQSGLTYEQEKLYRWKGIQLIFRIAEYLKLGSHVMSTASIYFHRFFMRKAFAKDVRERGHDSFTFQELAPTCLFLAGKAEETYRKVTLIVEATMAVMDKTPQGKEMTEARCYRPDIQSKEWNRWRECILLYEERLLETLCFDLIVEQPHSIAVKSCKRLDTSRDMAQLTIVLLNALSYGAVSVFYDAATLAAGAFQQACNMVDVDPASFTDQLQPNGTWYDVFDVDPEEVSEVMVDIEEQLAYHDARIAESRPATLSTTLPINTTPNTPLRMEVDKPDTHQKRTHFASGESIVDYKQADSQEIDMAEDEAQTSTHDDEHRNGSAVIDSSSIEREERTNASRPMSRHGSKGNDIGPPPPFGIPDSSTEERREETISIPEKTAALKVHHEQIQQQNSVQQGETRREEAQQRNVEDALQREDIAQVIPVSQEDEQAAEIQNEEGDVDSEEEGQL